MAESITEMEMADNRLNRHGSVATMEWEWVSASGGTVSQSLGKINGKLCAMETDPDGTDAPDDNYDITILDEYSIDVLGGAGANRDTADTEIAYPAVGTYFQPVMSGSYTLTIAAAGDTKKGKIKLFLV